MPKIDTTFVALKPPIERTQLLSRHIDLKLPDTDQQGDSVFDSIRATSMQKYRHAIQTGTYTGEEVPASVNMEHFENIVASWNHLHPEMPCTSIPDGNVGPHFARFLQSPDAKPIEFGLVGFDSKDVKLTKGQPTRHKQLVIMHKHAGESAFVVIDSGITRNLQKGHYFLEQTIQEHPQSQFAYLVSHVQQSYVGCSNYLEFFMRTLASEKKCRPLLDHLLEKVRSGQMPDAYQEREAKFQAADFSNYGKMDLSRKIFFQFKAEVAGHKNLQVMDARLFFPARLYKYTTFLHVDHEKKMDVNDFIRLREAVGDKHFATDKVNAYGQSLTDYVNTHLIRKRLVWDEKLEWNNDKTEIMKRIPVYAEKKINGALEHGIARTLTKQFAQLGIPALPFVIDGKSPKEPRAMTSSEFAELYPDYKHYSQAIDKQKGA